MTGKVKPIHNDTLVRYRNFYSEAYKTADVICERAMYVLSLICEYFKVKKVDIFYFNNAEEGEVGWPALSEDSISYNAEWLGGTPENLCTSYWNFTKTMPIEYLFKTDDAIIYDIERQIKRDEEKKREIEDIKAKQDARSRTLIESAASKLTFQERKALGL